MTPERLRKTITALSPQLKEVQIFDVPKEAKELLIDDVAKLSIGFFIEESKHYQSFAISKTHIFLF